jgi:hypothetical protein
LKSKKEAKRPTKILTRSMSRPSESNPLLY